MVSETYTEAHSLEVMDFIDGLDVELEKEFYYPGETINGYVLLSCIANVKIRGKLQTAVMFNKVLLNSMHIKVCLRLA